MGGALQRNSHPHGVTTPEQRWLLGPPPPCAATSPPHCSNHCAPPPTPGGPPSQVARAWSAAPPPASATKASSVLMVATVNSVWAAADGARLAANDVALALGTQPHRVASLMVEARVKGPGGGLEGGCGRGGRGGGSGGGGNARGGATLMANAACHPPAPSLQRVVVAEHLFHNEEGRVTGAVTEALAATARLQRRVFNGASILLTTELVLCYLQGSSNG